MTNEESAETLAALEAAKVKYAEERTKRLRADEVDVIVIPYDPNDPKP